MAVARVPVQQVQGWQWRGELEAQEWERVQERERQRECHQRQLSAVTGCLRCQQPR
jgi:hypothetical protein